MTLNSTYSVAGPLPPTLPGGVVTQLRDMGPFGASGEGAVCTYMGMFLEGKLKTKR